ncbi:MAG: YDG domain-containing protein [Pseudomonadota bacterium]|nr:YDG domain-containing protein [Pseudomonadota bacterium]
MTADIRALDKLFDGSLVAILEGVLNGTISGDDVELQMSGLFANLELGENSVSIDASLIGADAGNYELIAPDSATARLLGFVQNEAYQSAIVSQPPLPRQLSVPGDAGYQLVVDENPLGLADNGQQ